MNWPSVTYIGGRPVDQKEDLANLDSCCDHVRIDPSVAMYIRKENDTFGTVASHVVCSDCNEKADEVEGEELETCHDCGQEYPKKDTISWKWYDFSYAEGSEPLVICKGCKTKERHLERVRKDTADYEAEMAYYAQA